MSFSLDRIIQFMPQKMPRKLKYLVTLTLFTDYKASNSESLILLRSTRQKKERDLCWKTARQRAWIIESVQKVLKTHWDINLDERKRRKILQGVCTFAPEVHHQAPNLQISNCSMCVCVRARLTTAIHSWQTRTHKAKSLVLRSQWQRCSWPPG